MRASNQAVFVSTRAPKKKREKIKMPWKDRAKVRKYFGDEWWKLRRLAHVLKSSGPEEAARWAKSMPGLLREIGRGGIGSNGSRHTKIAELARKALLILEATTSKAG